MSLLVLDIFNMSMEFNWVSLDIHWYTFHMVFVPLVRILEEFCRFCIFIEVWISQLIINTNNSWNWYCLCAIILFTLMYYKGTIKDCPYQQRMDSLPGLFLPVAVWSTLPPISLSFPTSYWPAWTLPPLILPALIEVHFLPPFTHNEDGGNMVLWNVGILTHHYTVSQSRRLRLHFHLYFSLTLLFTVNFPDYFKLLNYHLSIVFPLLFIHLLPY